MANYLQVDDPAMPMHSQPNPSSKISPVIGSIQVTVASWAAHQPHPRVERKTEVIAPARGAGGQFKLIEAPARPLRH